ncbi:hypothetical protein [Halotia branconii]|uniref:Uncharacterized protein n=1 Tax=Halotia branconii CENA392 TaxID=1539056 RepID=A0AAJ6NNM5_9CYAN|nr:hypothetical protein [Halotia branconii]WGV23723.1 hypothetical protein QI031_18120 [Halotia branconii CENA392]
MISRLGYAIAVFLIVEIKIDIDAATAKMLFTGGIIQRFSMNNRGISINSDSVNSNYPK